MCRVLENSATNDMPTTGFVCKWQQKEERIGSNNNTLCLQRKCKLST